MRSLWLDADSLILPHRGPYRVEAVPPYWQFIKEQAEKGIMGSPELILDLELTNSDPTKADGLEKWAKPLKGILFLPADHDVQLKYDEVVDYVQNDQRFKQTEIPPFLAKADPWLVAYAAALGGRIVTFEKPQPQARKPKIPDVALYFQVQCVNLWDVLVELDFKIS